MDNYQNINPSIEEYKNLIDEKDKTIAVNHTQFLKWLETR
jgi:hypothetical protein